MASDCQKQNATMTAKLLVGAKRRPLELAIRVFNSKVQRALDSQECWIWTGSKDTHGYGTFGYDGKAWCAHRFAWFAKFGEIPGGMFVCHHCDNPICVNLSHLFLGTCADNNHDMMSKGRFRTPRGELRPNSKLSFPIAVSVRELFIHGTTIDALSKKFSVHPSTIKSVIYGRTWVQCHD